MSSLHSPLANKVSRISSKSSDQRQLLRFPQTLRARSWVPPACALGTHSLIGKSSNSPLEVRSSTPRDPICQLPFPSSFTNSRVYLQRFLSSGSSLEGSLEGRQKMKLARVWGSMNFQCWWNVLTPFSSLTIASSRCLKGKSKTWIYCSSVPRFWSASEERHTRRVTSDPRRHMGVTATQSRVDEAWH